MPDVMEPTRVDRPAALETWVVHGTALATWVVHGTNWSVQRKGIEVRVNRGGDRLLTATPDHARELAPAIAAAAEWTDTDVVDATIVDDRPPIEYRWLVEGLTQIAPPWMTFTAARSMSEDLAGWLAHNTPVVILRNGKEWAP